MKVPPGASGSSTTSAAPNGADQSNGGEKLDPRQLYSTGIGAPSANAGLLIVNDPVAGACAKVRPTVVTFGASGAVLPLPLLTP
jgi:hypothetical protein